MRARARAHYTRARGFTGVRSLRRRVKGCVICPGYTVGTATACVGMMKMRYARHHSVYIII